MKVVKEVEFKGELVKITPILDWMEAEVMNSWKA